MLNLAETAIVLMEIIFSLSPSEISDKAYRDVNVWVCSEALLLGGRYQENVHPGRGRTGVPGALIIPVLSECLWEPEPLMG